MKVSENLTDDQITGLEKLILVNKPLSLQDYKFYRGTKKIKDNVWDIIKACEEYITIDDRNNIQCYPNKNRSLGDIFLLMKFYYPEITLKEVRQGLYDLINEHRICSLQCSAIKKRVYYTQLNKHACCSAYNNIISLDRPDEYGYFIKY